MAAVLAGSAENLGRLAAALRGLDAQIELGDMDSDALGLQPDEVGLQAGGDWARQTRFGRLDVMQDVPGLRSYKQLLAGAVEVNGVLFAGYSELISMKTAAGRNEDLRDIGALETARSASRLLSRSRVFCETFRRVSRSRC